MTKVSRDFVRHDEAELEVHYYSGYAFKGRPNSRMRFKCRCGVLMVVYNWDCSVDAFRWINISTGHVSEIVSHGALEPRVGCRANLTQRPYIRISYLEHTQLLEGLSGTMRFERVMDLMLWVGCTPQDGMPCANQDAHRAPGDTSRHNNQV